MIYEIYHETKFEYGAIVTFSHNLARLKPKTCQTQKLLEYNLNISPTPYETSQFIDYFGNTNNFMLIRESHQSLTVTAISKVERINIPERVSEVKFKSDLTNVKPTDLTKILTNGQLFKDT